MVYLPLVFVLVYFAVGFVHLGVFVFSVLNRNEELSVYDLLLGSVIVIAWPFALEHWHKLVIERCVWKRKS